jgi:hypothetical protein
MNHLPFAVRLVSLIAVAALLAASARPAAAELFAYEGFSYAAGSLGGQNGGSGFIAGWTTTTHPTTMAATTNVAAVGLTYTDALGNSLNVTGGSAISTGPETGGTDGSAQRNLTTLHAGLDTTTWWSFIGQRLQPHATPDANLARSSSLQLRISSPVQEKIAVGKGTTTGATQTNWSMLHSGSVANAVYTSDPILEKSFVVVRIDHVYDSTAADNAWVWINPNLNAEPATASADQSILNAVDLSFDQVRVFAGRTASGNAFASFQFDEIRLGSTVADVAPFSAGTAADANFDQDADVDGNDFLVWQRNYGLGNQSTNANGDADGNGTVGDGDYTAWRNQFGPAASGAGNAVPEPTAAGLALRAALTLHAIRRRGR